MSPSLCHRLIVEDEKLLDFVSQWGRGLWGPPGEQRIVKALSHPYYRDIELSKVKSALRDAAMRPCGYKRLPQDFDAFVFCHKQGFLHIEQASPGSEELIFLFASPLHRRYGESFDIPTKIYLLTTYRIAYRRLCPGPEPGINSKNVTLQQTCLNAIE